MPAARITAVGSALSAAPASGDLFPIVDVSDTSQSADGTTKRVTMANVIGAVEGNANTFTKAQMFLGGLRSGESVTMTDDDAITITPTVKDGILLIWPVSTAITANNRNQAMAIIMYRAATTPAAIMMAQPASRVEVSTSVLTGTTGTDGNITVSANNNGNLYVENRLGAAILFRWLLVG